MCQGVIFIYNHNTNEYHWGIGSHSDLIKKVYHTERPKFYDYLVRMECKLKQGPGDFWIEGGRYDNDLKMMFKDKILQMVGNASKLMGFIREKINSGFKWDYSFLSILNRDGTNKFHSLLKHNEQEFQDSLSSRQKLQLDQLLTLNTIDESNEDSSDLYTKAAICLFALGETKVILKGDRLKNFIKKRDNKVVQENRKIILADAKELINDNYGANDGRYFSLSREFHALEPTIGSMIYNDEMDLNQILTKKELSKYYQILNKEIVKAKKECQEFLKNEKSKHEIFAEVIKNNNNLIASWK